ncbi:hypothetical protein CFBP6624_24895 (plasmid) [Agrobacterium tumefaciens]|uniref:Uncharacterized protein n=1 Tax=Agrobacterium tumefaciens TaxID=358 RepID=A0AAE6EN29_AGRTU|nr:hypothetical protein CFBP6624_24895 [Agrobacterium tumefaciens]
MCARRLKPLPLLPPDLAGQARLQEVSCTCLSMEGGRQAAATHRLRPLQTPYLDKERSQPPDRPTSQ